jgi:hypothetical protein
LEDSQTDGKPPGGIPVGEPLPTRNGVSFSKGHLPPSRLRVNGYSVEGYELKGIIPKWGELSNDFEDGRFNPILSSFL